MGLVILTRPIRNIDPNNLSKWNGAFSPILYTGIRKDVVVTSIPSGNSTSINVNWLGFVNQVPEVGELIFISAGQYKGAFKVLSASTSLVVLDAPFIGPAYGGFFNLNSTRPNYHIQLELYRIVNSAYVLVSTQIFRNRPDGTFSFDVRALLKRVIKFQNDYDYVTINKRDTNVSSGFNFRYKEVFSTSILGTSQLPFSNFDERDVTYYVGAARQLKDEFGSNMAEYVPTPGSIGLFNGNFEISDSELDGWTDVTVQALSQISGCQLIYSSNDDIGASTWTSDTPLTDGVEYEVVVDKDVLLFASVTIIAGTNEQILSVSQGKEKITITANGTEFKIRFNSLVGGVQNQVKLNSVQVFFSQVPQPAKFLVDDFEPTYFKDYPFDLPFIHSDNLVDLGINRNRRFLDQNGVEISSSIDALDLSTNDFAVNRMIVGNPPPETKTIEVWLDAGVAKGVGYVVTGYVGGDGFNTYSSGTQTDNPTTANPQDQDNDIKVNLLQPEAPETKGGG